MQRRGFLASTTAFSANLAASLVPERSMSSDGTSIPITGPSVPELRAFDRFMVDFMQRWNVPGGQCAVAKDRRLVYARGFGYVDQPRSGQPLPAAVQPTSLFRVASVSKEFTAVTVLRLIEAGRVRLDDFAFEILRDLTPPAGTRPDPRLREITVRHLLEHAGGFVTTAAFDPQFAGLRLAAAAFHRRYPARAVDLIRYMLGQPLGFTPGTNYSYSNLGYNVLGRIIERLTDACYGDAVKEIIFKRVGIRRMHLMTRTTPSDRLADEVFYVDGDQYPTAYSIYEDDLFVRPYSYGGFDGAAIDAHGGWIASTIDLTRFVNAVNGKTGIQLLRPETIAVMLARPNLPNWVNTPQYYCLGWDYTPSQGIMGHSGAITFGTLSYCARLPNGITLATAFNHLDGNVEAMGKQNQNDSQTAARDVHHWPTHDLYPQFP